jgi:hypothetical protein
MWQQSLAHCTSKHGLARPALPHQGCARGISARRARKNVVNHRMHQDLSAHERLRVEADAHSRWTRLPIEVNKNVAALGLCFVDSEEISISKAAVDAQSVEDARDTFEQGGHSTQAHRFRLVVEVVAKRSNCTQISLDREEVPIHIIFPTIQVEVGPAMCLQYRTEFRNIERN